MVGSLGTGTAFTWSQCIAAFVQRLRGLGRIENRTVAIEYRWAQGRIERYMAIAIEFVRLMVDVIVTTRGAVDAVKWATSIISIIFAVANDPSPARHGGFSNERHPKRQTSSFRH